MAHGARTARWRPRLPNSMRDVDAVPRPLGRPHAVPRQRAQLQTSDLGNINTVGLPGVHEADDLRPRHPQWSQAIEPGVRSLVEAVTSGWGLITYDSCQGHAYPGTSLPPAERRVGILPRDRGEYAATAAALCRAVTRSATGMPAQVRVLLARSELTCEATSRATPVLDLALRPAAGYGWPEYFAVLDQATTVLAQALHGETPVPDVACGCAPQTVVAESARQLQP